MPLARVSKAKAANTKSPRPASKGTVKIAPSRKKKNDSLSPERVQTILNRLAEHYPKAVCALHHRNAWELMVATILSAQCTDVRVNMVTPELFQRFPTPEAMANASPAELEDLIRSTGFFRNKTKSLIGAARLLIQEFGGTVPRTMEQILTIPGVARKTGNVVLGSWYKIAVGIVVDTHVMRISRRLELTKATLPENIEQDLMQIVPAPQWIDFSHRVIHFGREICVARKPRCADCFLEDVCNSKDKTWSTH